MVWSRYPARLTLLIWLGYPVIVGASALVAALPIVAKTVNETRSTLLYRPMPGSFRESIAPPDHDFAQPDGIARTARPRNVYPRAEHRHNHVARPGAARRPESLSVRIARTSWSWTATPLILPTAVRSEWVIRAS